eukprot:TRINITY_DN104951_c0_g1_i1.p1 TRINITY_DN104951_c0_g1~~TRINITY_DN104951_c0_g1_i1.p1  ORF type:complete len:212 (-),score=23.10 TRINITY_DN104951_c0_g1_i1:201-836(-)
MWAEAVRSFNIVLVGDAGAGKSAFALKQLTGEFQSQYIPTVGPERRRTAHMTVLGKVNFNLCELPGNFHCPQIAPHCYSNSDGAIVMFSVTDKNSFERATSWVRTLRLHCPPNMALVLCGTKVDQTQNRVISIRKHVAPFAERKDLKYVEISSKTDYNLDRPLECLLQALEPTEPPLTFVPASAPMFTLEADLLLAHQGAGPPYTDSDDEW